MDTPPLPGADLLYQAAPCGLLLAAADGRLLAANDTLCGWLGSAEREPDARRRAELEAERARAFAYANSDGVEAHWDLVRTLVASVADTTIFPIQDLLGLGTEARMNVPGIAHGNWTFRVEDDALTPALAERLARLCDIYERIPQGVRRTP